MFGCLGEWLFHLGHVVFFLHGKTVGIPSMIQFLMAEVQGKGFSSTKWRYLFIGFLRVPGCPRGGGNWGTLRICREDWGTLGNIRDD